MLRKAPWALAMLGCMELALLGFLETVDGGRRLVVEGEVAGLE